MKIEVGQRYKHPGGGEYLVTTLCQIKDDETGIWINGVVYRPVRSGFDEAAAAACGESSCYARSIEDFEKRFLPI